MQAGAGVGSSHPYGPYATDTREATRRTLHTYLISKQLTVADMPVVCDAKSNGDVVAKRLAYDHGRGRQRGNTATKALKTRTFRENSWEHLCTPHTFLLRNSPVSRIKALQESRQCHCSGLVEAADCESTDSRCADVYDIMGYRYFRRPPCMMTHLCFLNAVAPARGVSHVSHPVGASQASHALHAEHISCLRKTIASSPRREVEESKLDKHPNGKGWGHNAVAGVYTECAEAARHVV